MTLIELTNGALGVNILWKVKTVRNFPLKYLPKTSPFGMAADATKLAHVQ